MKRTFLEHGRRSLWDRGTVPPNILTGGHYHECPPIFDIQSLGMVPFKQCASCSHVHSVYTVKRRTVDCLFMHCIVCVYG